MIDLHTHTQHSDGSSTVKEVLLEAEKIDLSLLSITDHNSVEAYIELRNPNIRSLFSGNIINGVEITTYYMGEIVEVLGYGFYIEMMREYLKRNTLSFKVKQLKEFELIKARYRQIGVIFDEKNIIFDPTKESCRESFVTEIKRHEGNYKFFLYEDSIYTQKGFTRQEVYNPNSPLYVDESSLYPDLKTAINMIHNSGGLAFFAHTFAYSKNIEESLQDILDKYDLDGLECYYTTFTKEQTEYLMNVCKQREMLMSGGSDFHGTRKVNHNLGIGDGTMSIPETLVSPWIDKYKQKIKV
jgi:hypothetical protein